MAEDSSEEADDEGPSTSYFKRIPARHVCPHCPKAFKFPNKLRNHLANFHSAAHKCVKCSEAFDTHSQLRAHWSKVHPKKHQCEQCDFSAKRPNELRRHVERSHSSEHGVPCPIRGCSAIFSYAKLKRHLTLAHCEESAVEVSRVASKKSRLPLLCCEHCDFETNEGTSVFQEHLDRMHGAGVVCPVEGCLERVSLKDLLSHLQSHGEPATSTSESPKKTVDISGLLTPTWTTDTDSHAESDRELDEGSEDGQDQETDSHAAIPGTSDALVCSICGKRSSNGRNLRRHVQRVHERAYAEKKPRPLLDCPRENCEKKFKCQSLLDDHVATHDGTIRFSCENCSKKFSSRALFAVHLKKYHLSSIKDYRAARRLA